MKPRTIGFDFDQTLADSKSGIASCLNALCIQYGVRDKEKEIEYLSTSGLTLDSILSHLFESSDIGIQRQEFLKIYPDLGIKGTKLLPGASELLNYLHAEGHRLVLISAKTQLNLDLSVSALGLKFDKVFGGTNSSDKSKVMIQNGVEVYIGDQASDVVAANVANVKAILICEFPITIESFHYPHFYFKDLVTLKESFASVLKT